MTSSLQTHLRKLALARRGEGGGEEMKGSFPYFRRLSLQKMVALAGSTSQGQRAAGPWPISLGHPPAPYFA